MIIAGLACESWVKYSRVEDGAEDDKKTFRRKTAASERQVRVRRGIDIDTATRLLAMAINRRRDSRLRRMDGGCGLQPHLSVCLQFLTSTAKVMVLQLRVLLLPHLKAPTHRFTSSLKSMEFSERHARYTLDIRLPDQGLRTRSSPATTARKRRRGSGGKGRKVRVLVRKAYGVDTE